MSITAYDRIRAAGERQGLQSDGVFVSYYLRKDGVEISALKDNYTVRHICTWVELEIAKSDTLLANEQRLLQQIAATETDDASR